MASVAGMGTLALPVVQQDRSVLLKTLGIVSCLGKWEAYNVHCSMTELWARSMRPQYRGSNILYYYFGGSSDNYNDDNTDNNHEQPFCSQIFHHIVC